MLLLVFMSGWRPCRRRLQSRSYRRRRPHSSDWSSRTSPSGSGGPACCSPRRRSDRFPVGPHLDPKYKETERSMWKSLTSHRIWDSVSTRGSVSLPYIYKSLKLSERYPVNRTLWICFVLFVGLNLWLTDNVGEVLHGCFDFLCFHIYNYFPALTFVFVCFLMAPIGQMLGSFLLYFYVLLLLCILTFKGCISVKIPRFNIKY